MNNQLTLVGRVGQEPKVIPFSETNNQVVKFSVAVTEYSSKQEPETMWINVDAWNGVGERVLKCITKGREVALTGRLAIASYTKEVDGKTIEVQKPVLKLTSFHLCGAKPVEEDDNTPRQLSLVISEPKKKARKAR